MVCLLPKCLGLSTDAYTTKHPALSAYVLHDQLPCDPFPTRPYPVPIDSGAYGPSAVRRSLGWPSHSNRIQTIGVPAETYRAPLGLQAHPAPNAERGTPQPLTLTIQFLGPKLRRPANRPLTPAAPFHVDWHTCTATRGRNTPPQACEAPTPPRSISPRLRARCHSIGRYDALGAATHTQY